MDGEDSGFSLGDQPLIAGKRVSSEGKAQDGSHPDAQLLIDREDFNDSIAEKTSDFISIVTGSTHPTYVYLNPSHKKLLGCEPSQWLGKSPLGLIHSEDRDAFLKLLKRHGLSRTKDGIRRDGEELPHRALLRMKDQSGNHRYLETTVDLLEKARFLLVSKDITEETKGREKLQEEAEGLKQRLKEQNEEISNSKKVLKEEIFKRWRAEEAFRESEEENQRLLESFEDGYFEVDLTGNLTFFNESLSRIVGYSHQEMMGMNNRQYMSPETSKKVYETFNEVFRTGKATKAFGWELVRKDGEVRQVETSVSPIFGPGGDKIGFRGIARDVTERWMAEQACRRSEEKYREIIETIEDGYYEVDLKGNLVFFNVALTKTLGYSSEEMMGMNNRQYMTEKTAKTVYETFNEVYRTGRPTKASDWEVVRKGGEKKFLETSVSPVRDSSGQVTGFSGIARDVTERRFARKALEESEEKYRTILQSIEDGYYEVDLEGNLIFFNEALCRITGYPPEELHGMNNRDYTEPETAKKMFEVFNRVYRSGEPSKVDDYVVIKKDGTKSLMELSTSLMRDAADEAIGFRGIARDVTVRERMKQELKESEKKYRTILESIEDGYFEVDVKGNFVFFNDSMCKILGYSAQELKGMNNRTFMTEETSKRVFQTFNQVYRAGQPTKAFGWELIRKDGERRYVETSVSLMRNAGGEPDGFRGVARDVSESKRLEKAKERAINHLSHELGTPLSIIADVLNRMPDELRKGNMQRVHEWLDRMKRNIKRLRDLQTKIEDIVSEKPVQEKERILNIIETAMTFLDELKDEPLKEGGEAVRQLIVKRLESLHKVEESRRETIMLDTFIDQVCQEARLAMQKRELEILQKGEKGICVEMDPKVLKTVCEGFLKNAIENTPDEGKIEIELKAEGDLAKLYFHDFGMGITPENQKLIFSGFFHTQDTDSYASKKPYLFNAGGSGSDLLRARTLSERFGFTVDFCSTRCRHLPSDKDDCPGRISSCPYIKGKEDCLNSGGSTFSLHLPLRGRP